jgi:hypothetical protein
LLASTSFAAVSVHVYRADEQTPLKWVDPNIPDVYRDIMVGTRLTLFVVSDTALPSWSGGLRIRWDDWNRGTVAARGYNEDTSNYEGSILPACGLDYGFVSNSPDDSSVKFSLATFDPCAVGGWFVLDYCAEAVGTCIVGVFGVQADEIPDEINPQYRDEPPPAGKVWTQFLSFNHVPSRDYDGDSTVNFVDFALWADQWREISLSDPNAPDPIAPNTPVTSDLNADGTVGLADLGLFCEYWLERTDIVELRPDPNVSEVP